MGRLRELYINQVIDYLASEGERIAIDAKGTRDTNIDTGNQEDAYGWGVYFQGKLVKYGYPVPKGATEKHVDINGQKGWGRDWIFQFLSKDFKPETDGFCLVVANAAWYSVDHEDGATPTGTKYRIISQSIGMMNSLKQKFKGATLHSFNLDYYAV